MERHVVIIEVNDFDDKNHVYSVELHRNTAGYRMEDVREEYYSSSRIENAKKKAMDLVVKYSAMLIDNTLGSEP